MGTRNLTAVMVEGKYVIAQYGQWDGYPSGQGAIALDFCREHLSTQEGRVRFRDKLKQCRWATQEEIDEAHRKAGVTGEWLTMEQADAFGELMPFLSRDHGAQILNMVMSHDGEVLLSDAISFAGDSLFCEWAYVVDLDKGTFEVFRGFSKSPVPEGERFASAPLDEKNRGGDRYYQVRNIVTWSLDSLPEPESFLSQFEAPEE